MQDKYVHEFAVSTESWERYKCTKGIKYRKKWGEG
jgi:hypothetical protein